MADLRQSLYALVEHPPAPPPAVEVIAARGTRFRRSRRVRRGVAGLALAVVASVAGLGLLGQRSEEGVVLATGGRTSAGYIAERPGGYVATGTWTITITRGGQVIELSGDAGDRCARTGIILPGDEVRGSIEGERSALRVGETFTCPD